MKKIYFVLFAILCTIIFSCTDNLISTDLDSHTNSSTGELKVFVKQSRLFSPVISEISWTVELVDEENNAYSSKETNGYFLFSNLKLGTYTVNASGKDSLGAERFCGAITINFDSAKPLEVFVPVSASKNPNSDITSTGFATITMDMSDELLDILYSMGEDVILEVRLLGIDDTNADLDVSTNFADVTYNDNLEIESIDIFDNQQITFAYTDYSQPSQIQTNDIPVGYYNLSFVGLEDYGYSIKLKDNLVEVGAGLTTNIVLTQNDYEIVENYSSSLYVNNEGGETADGKTLSNPIGFSKLTVEDFIDNELIYLLSDVDFVYDTETKNLYPDLRSFSATISSFGSTVRTISANISDYDSITLGDGIILRNVKLSGPNGFYVNNLIVDETVILDCEMGADYPFVQLSKTSNLQIGNNFSGDLYLLLNGDWKLGDTVINFENGKPENSNFYIDSECENFSGQKYSAMFYIDDSGKLAKYTDDFTSFAWSETMPCLVTKTQAKNNTYTSIFYNASNKLSFTGISTYDGDKTWYFICDNNQSYSLYKVSPSQNYENSVYADVIELPVSDTNGGISLDSVRYMSYDAGKLYFLSQVDYYQIDSYDITSEELGDTYNISIQLSDGRPYPSPTAFYVKGNDFYFATDFKDYNQPDNPITHSAIWKCELTMEETDNGTFYNLNHIQTYQTEYGMEYPVPYYLTQNDNSLTIDNSFPEGSTFRITDLYSSEDGSIYGLLANYIEKVNFDSVSEEDKNKSFMRGSVFKLEQNTSRQNDSDPIMNAIHGGLINSFPISSNDLPDVKQNFILPRKIVGIVNKKLIIADDGMIPDENDCNLDRFILFDLDGTISEKIDVNVTFTTSGVSSIGRYHTTETLF